MSLTTETYPGPSHFSGRLKSALSVAPRIDDRVGVSRAPAVVDVMGGICEEEGALVVTATIGLSVGAGCWQTATDRLSIQCYGPEEDGSPRQYSMAMSDLGAHGATAEQVFEACLRGGAEWAAPICLGLHRAIQDRVVPRPERGLGVLVDSGFPCGVDFGQPCATAAAVVDALCRMSGASMETPNKAAVVAYGVLPLTGVPRMRIALTTLRGAGNGSLLKLHVAPKVSCQTIALPPGVTLRVLHTRLVRPTRPERFQETRLCAEMGARMISALRGGEAGPVGGRGELLASITPSDYVRHYRDRLPTKITLSAFRSKYGEVRGLPSDGNPKSAFKIRSRAEHNIYENDRAHNFVANILRAQKGTSSDAMVKAGELMFNSHWSHSQRCGIGGVEADTIVKEIRERGAPQGLYGAKITSSGQSGEIVVLMRDDDAAHAALQSALDAARAQVGSPIDVFGGSSDGAELFQVGGELSKFLGTAVAAPAAPSVPAGAV